MAEPDRIDVLDSAADIDPDQTSRDPAIQRVIDEFVSHRPTGPEIPLGH